MLIVGIQDKREESAHILICDISSDSRRTLKSFSAVEMAKTGSLSDIAMQGDKMAVLFDESLLVYTLSRE